MMAFVDYDVADTDSGYNKYHVTKLTHDLPGWYYFFCVASIADTERSSSTFARVLGLLLRFLLLSLPKINIFDVLPLFFQSDVAYDFRILMFDLPWENRRWFIHSPDLFDEIINTITCFKFRSFGDFQFYEFRLVSENYGFLHIFGEIDDICLQAAESCVVHLCEGFINVCRVCYYFTFRILGCGYCPVCELLSLV